MMTHHVHIPISHCYGPTNSHAVRCLHVSQLVILDCPLQPAWITAPYVVMSIKVFFNSLST